MPETTASTLATRLRERRDSAGLSREKLAAKAGVSLSTVLRIEQGAGAHLSSLRKIAGALDVTVSELVD